MTGRICMRRRKIWIEMLCSFLSRKNIEKLVAIATVVVVPILRFKYILLIFSSLIKNSIIFWEHNSKIAEEKIYRLRKLSFSSFFISYLKAPRSFRFEEKALAIFGLETLYTQKVVTSRWSTLPVFLGKRHQWIKFSTTMTIKLSFI